MTILLYTLLLNHKLPLNQSSYILDSWLLGFVCAGASEIARLDVILAEVRPMSTMDWISFEMRSKLRKDIPRRVKQRVRIGKVLSNRLHPGDVNSSNLTDPNGALEST